MNEEYIKIHYYGYSAKYDEWIQKKSGIFDLININLINVLDRIAEIGSHSKAYGAAKFRDCGKKLTSKRKLYTQMVIDEVSV